MEMRTSSRPAASVAPLPAAAAPARSSASWGRTAPARRPRCACWRRCCRRVAAKRRWPATTCVRRRLRCASASATSRVTPVSRFALLLGRALRDIVTLLVQSLLLVLVALPFGLHIQAVGLLVMLALIALIGLLTASLSYALALWLKSEDAFAPLLFTATLPLLLLSGVLLPLSLAPDWLRAIANANPLAYAADAARSLFNNHLGDASVARGVLIMGLLAVVAVVI